MKNNQNRAQTSTVLAESSGGAAPPEDFPLPESVIAAEIFPRLELDSLCTLACVCRNFSSLVPEALSTLPSLDFSAFSPDVELVRRLVPRLSRVKKVTIDCLRLDKPSILSILGPEMEELFLFKCASMCTQDLDKIADKCPNLRVLVVELAWEDSAEIMKRNAINMLKKLPYLEHCSMKVGRCSLSFIDVFLWTQRVIDKDSLSWYLRRFTQVGDVMTDLLMALITFQFPALVALNLEDRPFAQPRRTYDLTNTGFESLVASFEHLTHLSIVRSSPPNRSVYFERVNDSALLLVAERCVRLESVKLGGFSKVTDVGFSALLRSCHRLKTYAITNAPLLSDLAFRKIASPLVELNICSCNLITGEALAKLSSPSTLETLDLKDCISVKNSVLDHISHLGTLTSLNLGGAHVTDGGLRMLSRSDLALTFLSLRGCRRVTSRGLIYLFEAGVRINKTLLSLDVGHMPGMSDKAVEAIISNSDITELCLRHCPQVTDDSIRILAEGRNNRSNLLQTLDVCCCAGFSAGTVEFLRAPLFRGLRWIGVGGTSLEKSNDFGEIRRIRPVLTICCEGCEVRCRDGWRFHRR